MRRLLEVFGAVLDAFIGPSVTTRHDKEIRNARFELRPSVNDPEMEIGIVSHRVVYVTHFKRWGLSFTRSVFEVRGFALEEVRHKFDSRLFECVCYPTLCLGVLKWTEYPHVYAIRAYVERVLPDHQLDTIKVTL